MRAVVVEALVGPDGAVLREDVPEPEGAHWLSPDERMLVDVHAAAICFPDLLQTRGQYQHSVPAPFIAGGEVAGVVVEAPAASGFAPGDRVLGLARRGAMAERALVPPGYVLRLPETLSFAEGAAVYINYCTAWYALHRAGAKAGETVLVTGAAGGVGTALLQIAPAFGVRTIALVSGPAKAAAARELGADEVLLTSEPWAEAARGRAHVVVDMVGGDGFLDAVRALRVGGRLVVVGFAGGGIPTIKVNRLLLRNLTLVGISMDIMEEEHPGTVATINAAVQRLLDDGTIRPVIGARVPLADGAEALALMERRAAPGKIVVDVRD
ncbi:MAG TPA: NADPH:quinone oxidoreductase family protein [Baekduia sp.]|uniref:NADPH:quinone oxidoreductase family protein n=1 Tax=Baekduia sp. TaxID=2600305 RepID=UPI002D767292|nr:NADPH:quinone oxidoreductase family protein [Baekduia sp.]HET6507920.1 NADPH:quinone oxidoreductase family protein [Baekduia sp.]